MQLAAPATLRGTPGHLGAGAVTGSPISRTAAATSSPRDDFQKPVSPSWDQAAQARCRHWDSAPLPKGRDPQAAPRPAGGKPPLLSSFHQIRHRNPNRSDNGAKTAVINTGSACLPREPWVSGTRHTDLPAEPLLMHLEPGPTDMLTLMLAM